MDWVAHRLILVNLIALYFYHKEFLHSKKNGAYLRFPPGGIPRKLGIEVLMKKPSLRRLLSRKQKKPLSSKSDLEAEIRELQLQMLRVQAGVWHAKGRVILAFEGFDAAGKGGCIRTLVETLDPRGVAVHAIGPPSPEEQARHWLYRFWKAIPQPGTIAVFDRTWYGRVLVEKVDRLAPEKRIREAYGEIREFEQTLRQDGIVILKFFLGISKEEQLARFEERLLDPYKQWKLSEADVHARKKWDDYVRAVDKMFAKSEDWNLVPADYKHAARAQVLRVTTKELKHWGHWIEKEATALGRRSLIDELRKLGKKDRELR